MTTNEHSRAPWLRLVISEVEPGGVDGRVLARLLQDLSDAMLAAARERLGIPIRRSGPPSAAERRLAAIRVEWVMPGSLDFGFNEPAPVLEYQTTFDREVTSDLIAQQFLIDVQSARSDRAPIWADDDSATVSSRRSAVARVLRAARSIGDFAEFSHRRESGEIERVSVDLRGPERRQAPVESEREVAVYGHAYMVDVELGRQRLRVKLPSGRDSTMDLDPDLRSEATSLLDQPVKAIVKETVRDGSTVRRVVRSVELVELRERGPELPPKDLATLAREQGLLFRPVPDYVARASAVWPTERDVDEFARLVGASRLDSA